jgi:Domain of unknown function (DUF2017)
VSGGRQGATGGQEPERGGGQTPEQDGGQEPQEDGGQEPEEGGGQEPEQGGGQEPEQGGGQEPEQGGGQESDEAVSLEDLMAGFRGTSGGATARFAAAQAAIIRDLVGQIIELIGADAEDDDATEPGETAPSGPGHPSGGLPTDGTVDADDLDAMVGFAEDAELPDDPVLARLLPDAYRDDPEASGEFRRYTEQGLRSGKAAAARTVLATLPPGGGRIRLSEPEGQAWLRALNDVRLALGTRLGVTDDFDDQVADMGAEDPRAAYVGVYQWLAFLQESLVQALSR